VQVSTAGGVQPIWSRDGRGLFYRQPGSERAPGFLMRATIARAGALRVTRRDTLFRDVFYTIDVANYDVFPGDRELLLIRPNPPAAHVTVVLDWPEVLLRQHARD
jgi:hypothetical protein